MTKLRLQVDKLSSSYGSFQALFDVDLTLGPGEKLALIGANGAGKSTLLKTLAGLLPAPPGAVHHNGTCLSGRSAAAITSAGIALVPEGRRLFASLTVEENLKLGGHVSRPGMWNLEAVYALFPVLLEKRRQLAPMLSGGQQQMVAIGRALMANPDILLLDELSLGLAPVVVEDIYRALPRIIRQDVSVILVEQDIRRALAASDRFACMRAGRVVLEGRAAEADRDAIVAAYFGAGA